MHIQEKSMITQVARLPAGVSSFRMVNSNSISPISQAGGEQKRCDWAMRGTDELNKKGQKKISWPLIMNRDS